MSCVVSNFTFTSPIGKMLVAYCTKGLHYVKQVEFTTDDLFKPDIRTKIDLVQNQESTGENEKIVSETLQWFQTYFIEPNKTREMEIPTICVASEYGSFREKVWLALAESVKSGNTISYGGLAKLMDKPGASRAVGTAMSNNPIQIIVPCHRVIKSDGTLGNYAKGCRNNVKKWLLNHEGALETI